jgi:hypothetical protein
MKMFRSLFVLSILLGVMQVHAEISFVESTNLSGLNHHGSTFGASWGDLNNDGWPDLWVGNHNKKPNLYLNNGDGTFTDVIDKVWSGDPDADTHGAAWADFDNDGDQDLIELVGAKTNKDGSLCFGCGKNHLYENNNGHLIENAKLYGLDVIGFARTPLWVDANSDGKLDVVIVNTRNRKTKSTSEFYLNTGKGFKKYTNEIGFEDKEWGFGDKLVSSLRNLLRFKLKSTNNMITHKQLVFASLGDLAGDIRAELMLFSDPTRIYQIDDDFDDATNTIGLPVINGISDAAIGDFDGDSFQDIYLTRGRFLSADAYKPDANVVKGSLRKSHTVTFKSKGKIEFQIYPEWRNLNKIYIGSAGKHPQSRLFKLDPDDMSVRGPEYSKIPKRSGVSIYYDEKSKEWTISNYSTFVDFIARSENAIEKIKTIGFDYFTELGKDSLLMQKGDSFKAKAMQGDAGGHTSCHSVASGDYDNDMDLDIYLVCTGPVRNIPNRLLENDGKGNFRLVTNAGGAVGSKLGRGDIVAVADYNRDGFLDLFVSNGFDPDSPFVKDGPHQLYLNKGNNNNWIEIDLEGVKSNRDGIGATVVIETNGIKQIRIQNGGMHRIAQNFQRIHFGLGKHKKIDSMAIHWPSGIVQKLYNPVINQVLKIREDPGSGL